MDVQCERCKTEYEFDDALVSGRGTTVRCTNCGHQFKVRKQEVSEPGAEADRWLVRTALGQDLTFLTLRELQRAILAKQVGRSDVLRRGQTAPRALGTIAELEPFFEGRASSRPPPPGAASAVPRIPPAAAVPRTPPPPAFPKRTASWGIPETVPPGLPPVRQKIDTLRPAGTAAAPPPPPPMTPAPVSVGPVIPLQMANAASHAPSHAPFEEPVTQRRPGPSTAPPPAPPTQRIETSSPLPPPTVPVRQRISYGDEDANDARRSVPSAQYDDYAVPRRRKVGGWIVALVLMMAVGVVGWVVAKPYLSQHQAAAVAALDPRAQAFVNDGERAMGDGSLDGAQEAFDKASALAEHDPRVLLDEARVAAAKADVPWLKTRLLPADAKDDTRATKADLADRQARARKAADAASAAAPDDPGAIRAHIDALRISGERDLARHDVSRIISQASQPETAYVLAALDLAEADPLWTALIDRLRLAASGEGSAGRARAALVYALAQSGDVASAKAELAKLDAMTRPYPLLPSLHAFVDRAPAKVSLDGGVAAAVPHVDLSSLPSQPPPPGAVAAGAAGGGGAGGGGGADTDEPAVPGTTGGAMKAAQAAIRKGTGTARARSTRPWCHAIRETRRRCQASATSHVRRVIRPGRCRPIAARWGSTRRTCPRCSAWPIRSGPAATTAVPSRATRTSSIASPRARTPPT